MSGTWAQVRIYALPEVQALLMPARPHPPSSILEQRFQEGLRNCCAWAEAGKIACAICGSELEGHASYLVVLMPLDPCWGIGTNSAVCVDCGQAPREEVLRRVEYSALLMFGPEGGHA